MPNAEGLRTPLRSSPGGNGCVDVGISYDRGTDKDVLLAPYVLGGGGAGPHCQVDFLPCCTLKGQEPCWELPLAGRATWVSGLAMATDEPTKTYLLPHMYLGLGGRGHIVRLISYHAVL